MGLERWFSLEGRHDKSKTKERGEIKLNLMLSATSVDVQFTLKQNIVQYERILRVFIEYHLRSDAVSFTHTHTPPSQCPIASIRLTRLMMDGDDLGMAGTHGRLGVAGPASVCGAPGPPPFGDGRVSLVGVHVDAGATHLGLRSLTPTPPAHPQERNRFRRPVLSGASTAFQFRK